MSNEEIISSLEEFALFHDLDGDVFRRRAFDRACDSLRQQSLGLADVYRDEGINGLMAIEGVGKGIAGIIEDLIKHGKSAELSALRKKWPMDVRELSRIDGVGPATIKKLYEELKIKDIEDLKKAISNGKILKVPRLGESVVEKIKRSLNYLSTIGERKRLDEAILIAESIKNFLLGIDGVIKVEIAGSLRRMQETIGDIDILLICRENASEKIRKNIIQSFIKSPFAKNIIASGEGSASIYLKNQMRCDLRLLNSNEFGSALLYFTGDKNHNVALRKLAISKGLKLSEYGLFRGSKSIAGKTEDEIYKKLGMGYVPPELRQGRDEIELALKGNLPTLIDYGDLKGDLQTQTDWSDGEHSIEEMAQSAKKAGLSYIVITDHTQSLTIANGLDEKRLLKQIDYIDSLNKRGGNFKILKGAEVNILKDGSLDIDDSVLAKLDVVGASVHSHFEMSKADMTARIARAVENPNIDIIFHPTGRRIGKREAYEFDISAIAQLAVKHSVALEINAHPERLDLKTEHIREALLHGAKFSIDSDAHDIAGFDVLKYGIGTARRGGATKNDVINTKSAKDLLHWINKK